MSYPSRCVILAFFTCHESDCHVLTIMLHLCFILRFDTVLRSSGWKCNVNFLLTATVWSLVRDSHTWLTFRQFLRTRKLIPYPKCMYACIQKKGTNPLGVTTKHTELYTYLIVDAEISQLQSIQKVKKIDYQTKLVTDSNYSPPVIGSKAAVLQYTWFSSGILQGTHRLPNVSRV